MDDTSNIGASSLLGSDPATPPVTTTETMRADAYRNIEAWKRDPEFQGRLLKGDADARRQLEDARRAMAAPTGLVVNGQLHEGQINTALDRYQEVSGLSDRQIEHVRTHEAITMDEARFWKHEKERLLQDGEFRERLYRGDRSARNYWSRVHAGLVSPIKVQ
jgi:PAS domain-containing protein